MDDACVDGDLCVTEVFVIPAMLDRLRKYVPLEWINETLKTRTRTIVRMRKNCKVKLVWLDAW